MDDQGFEGTREEMQRAIRRLHVLEYLILLAVAVLAVGGGALAAFVLSAGTDLPFGFTWVTISVVLVVVPAAFVFGKGRQGGGDSPGSSGNSQP